MNVAPNGSPRGTPRAHVAPRRPAAVSLLRSAAGALLGAAVVGLLVATFGGTAAAQSGMPAPTPRDVRPQDPLAPPGGTPPVDPRRELPTPGTQLPGATDALRAGWSLPRPQPQFQGFPVFPSQLQGYGGYPSRGPAGQPGVGALPLLPPVPAEPVEPGWPDWARTRDKAPLPFAPDLALLIRNADRVWFRPNAEEPFVPLFFHDKLRTLSAGASIEVRQNGEFELLLHQSTRVQTRGPTAIDLLALTATEVSLRVRALTWLRLGASSRTHSVQLPDGSTLFVDAPPAPAAGPFAPPPDPMSAPLDGVTDIVLARVDEPAWLGGRATMTNLGATTVRWQHAGGEATLAPGHRLTLFLRPPGAVEPAELVVRDGEQQRVEAGVVCRSAGGGSATWSGARFELPPGASVRFDPQQGRPFDPPAPKPPRPPADPATTAPPAPR